MTKRIVLFTYDVLCALVCAVVLAAGFVRPAYAYVDPSVMTYAIQAIAGVAVALSTVLGVAMRRTRKKLAKAMGYDENARKKREPRVHKLDAEGNPILTAADTAVAATPSKRRGAHRSGQQKPEIYAPKWTVRLVIGLLVSAFVVFTLLVVAPYELIAGNESSLAYGLKDIWQVFIVPSLVVMVVLTVILCVLRGRAFNAVALLLFGFGLATYIQVMIFNGSLPSADGAAIDWTMYRLRTVVTTIAWIVIVILPFEISRFNHKLVQGVAAFIAAALIIVQGVGIGSLFLSLPSDQSGAQTDEFGYIDSEYRLTTEGLYTVSDKKNAIVFVLDMYDTTDLIAALEEEPDLLEEMTGFTWYQNDTTVITPTRNAIPSLLTGFSPSPENDLLVQLKTCYSDGPYVNDLAAAGYSVGVYSDSAPTTLPLFMDSLINSIAPEDEGNIAVSIDEVSTIKQLWICALFRDLPWVCKPFFWFYTDDINNAMVGSGSDSSDVSITPYTIDDVSYYKTLCESKLSATDEGETGAFRFIHLKGAHYPYTMDENCEAASDGSISRTQQAIGSMKIVAEYLRQLKELGLYDDATIIITADHGYFEASEPFALLDDSTTPVMLVKSAQSTTQNSDGVTISQAPTSNGDVMATIFADIGLTPSTTHGLNMLSLDESLDRTRYFLSLSKTAGTDGVEHGVVQYAINGNSLDYSNWTATGWIYTWADSAWIKRS